MIKKISLLVGLMCALFLTQSSLAQVTTGTISGTVSDSTGAVIPGATITIRNVETGISRTITTDAVGLYRAQQLGLGSYEVTVESTGFQSVVRSGITLTVGREAVVDFSLQVGAVAERITVTGEAPLIETTNATVSSLVDERAMRDLPLLGRGFADLTAIQPGVVSDIPAGSGSSSVYQGGRGASGRSIGGAKPMQSTYLLDGLEITTPSELMPVTSVLGQQLGVEAIREFSVLQSNFGAQYGRAAGGVVNAVTRSGTNELHGSVFHFFRNDVLDARDYFLDIRLPKEPLKRNQFGAALGGPIQKDRTFFFVNYEGLRQAAGDPNIGATLTPETRQGRVTNAQGRWTTTLPVDENVKIFFPLLPLPNGPYRNGGVADYQSVDPWHADENYGIGRIDQQLSEKDSLFGRFTKDRSARTDKNVLLLPEGFFGYQFGGYVLASVSETHIFSPAVLNIARLGFTRRNDTIFYNYSMRGKFFPQGHPDLDRRFASVRGVPFGGWSIPGVSIKGGVGISNCAGPAVFVDNTFDFDDSVILNFGPHSLTVGGNIKRYQMNNLNEPWTYTNWNWLTIERFLTNRPYQTIQRMGTHVPGLQHADVYRGWRQTYGALYIQDDFRVLPNLTLNLGVRWEQVSSPREVNGKLTVVNDLYRDKGLTILGKGDALFEIRDGLKGFSPRFGFAWTPFADQKTVIRGGFGHFREVPLVYMYQLSTDAPPYSIRYVVSDPYLKFPFPFDEKNFDPAKAQAQEPVNQPVDYKMPYTMQWTFSLERQLGETLVIKANYVGTRGVDQIGTYNPNAQTPVLVNGRHFVPADAKQQNPAFNGFYYSAPIGNSWYHAGQLVLEQRFRSGLRFSGSYTFSRNIDQVPGFVKGSGNIGGTDQMVYNDFNYKADQGLSALHVKHNFIASYTYELPFGSGRRWGSQWTGVLDYVLGGWALNGTTSFRTGLAQQITQTPRQNRCMQQRCTSWPDLKPGGNNNPILDNWTPEQYFDVSQFVQQPEGFYGNVGKNTLTRPSLRSWNFSLAKDNRLGEGKNLEFRAEFFNFLNHPNFGTPGGGIFRNAAGALSGTAGRITSLAASMRQVQLGLKLTF